MTGSGKGLLRNGTAARAALVAVLAAMLAACGSTQAKNDTFALTSVATADGPSARSRQILVPPPSALKALDGEQIVIRPSASEIQYLAGAQWSDSLSKMVQAKLVQAFENTGRLGGVGMPGQGLAIDYQIVTDIRAFEVQTAGADAAVVEISAKLLNDRNGTVRAQKVFRATVPVGGTGNPAFVKALDAAFAAVTADIVGWTLASI
ncbi:ABC-type transport auxiliary lipoprotein family protein [Shinella yambaruensis]|uniref:ABC transporter n=1 Tax=Shinella yambaruensis TaxID=415996 RepID=A0ABQ5ZB89_9HYPH|nr:MULTISPECIES: ABC-type transport auxiliary lipoprotein family protein [Shinella]CAI0337984.1 Cholesterol transport system auxiliary component [Rhizobiaceae bacterium]CAK7256450.1 cholesterol transport system auxiliary component [Shinella sp. WSC3-e]MCJ8028344.1 ABC-type transport auxiliary lipoprotein family protein [Shinella yambaruensis]MCO5138382.1 ABC-type transport auxiliary lipoprotein family protein [Shinella sp.]MCU7980174.1 ABC-type transport auxiliary lipoprotein family protein [S